jgi:hypothetical protein
MNHAIKQRDKPFSACTVRLKMVYWRRTRSDLMTSRAPPGIKPSR